MKKRKFKTVMLNLCLEFSAAKTPLEFPLRSRLSSLRCRCRDFGSRLPACLPSGISQGERGNKAFTLAEVLITLVIIGVIGALTVPALIQNTQKQEYVTALKKAYSTLSQVTQMIISEEGSPKGDGGWTENSDSMYSMYKKHLSNIKDCNDKRGCFSQLDGGYNKLTGGKDVWNFDTYGKRLILADGMQVFFEGFGTSCSRQNWWGTQGYACGQIIVDLNGEKGPNTYARDVFMFVVQENGLVPAGNMQNYNCIASSGGLSCTHKVLTEGAMNY